MASGAEHHVPSWLRPGEPESRLPVLVAILLAVVLQRAVPDRYTVVPRWPLLAMELMLVVLLVAINPLRLSRRTTAARWGSLALTAAITVDNTASAVMLDYWILRGDVSNDAAVLLGSGGAIFVTNILAFALWYWELDRGGPFARHAVEQPYPDFLFPQMTDPDKAKPDWRPTFVDYMYVSFTNVVAFSPTDTMPLARWAKLMMTVQASVAMSTIALVIARAVNVLK
ncbi:hypothetical protein HZU40_18985 [Mycolicibacterium fluoranthenivorans]|uniref:DUF1345 domain-containing protein n=1 Tax=Mycolicibacterium fluoranthenivorans TaxID=258505 RepID=A0A7G8PPE3_9MYCO|nr:hypothetical protein [Mycobacterium hackensackense]QNJ96209.1 hypothetical protein HZU40_18985 [Mycolicibacterium fluoranthenivorans]